MTTCSKGLNCTLNSTATHAASDWSGEFGGGKKRRLTSRERPWVQSFLNIKLFSRGTEVEAVSWSAVAAC